MTSIHISGRLLDLIAQRQLALPPPVHMMEGDGGAGVSGPVITNQFIDPTVPSTQAAAIDAPFSFLIVAETGSDVSSSQFLFVADDGTTDNRFLVYVQAGNIKVQIRSGASNLADFVVGPVSINTAYRIAVRVAAGDHAASLGGAPVVTDDGGVWDAGVLDDSYRFGITVGTGNEFTGTISLVNEYKNQALGDDTLVSLTT